MHVYVVKFSNGRDVRMIGNNEGEILVKVDPYLKFAHTKVDSVEECSDCTKEVLRAKLRGDGSKAVRSTLTVDNKGNVHKTTVTRTRGNRVVLPPRPCKDCPK